jgi:monoamine oxidase
LPRVRTSGNVLAAIRSNNHSTTMKRISRRSFLTASAALTAAPALAGPAMPGDVDVVIVGAGAAGIAAARRVAAAGRTYRLIEAGPVTGGRCVTDTAIFGVPFDRGAHWIHMPELNPLAKLAPRAEFEIYPAPSGQRLRIGRRNARDGELEEFLAALVRSNKAIADAARGKADVSCAAVLPKDLRDWRSTVEFVLGPYGCGKELQEISAFDFAKSAERDVDAFCRQGLGALLRRLGASLNTTLATVVTRIDWGNRLEIETEKGRINARAVIVTASTNVLAAGKIKFVPDLPKRQLDALSQLKLGSYDHVALELPGNPLGLQRDDLIFEKSERARTAALLANVSGTSLATVEVAGRFGRDLSGQGEQALVAFAIDWLAELYGNDVKKAVKRTHATRWNAEPWALGAFSVASPGGQGARKVLMEPLRDRIYFAGEAAHETLWGTVGGAWESGVRAAEAILRKMSVLRDEPEPKLKPKAQQPRPPPRPRL